MSGVLPTWQITRTASMWRQCGGQPFEIPPIHHWPRNDLDPAFYPRPCTAGDRAGRGGVGLPQPGLNQCAGGAANSAHKDYFALDLIPLLPIRRLELMRRMCAVHARAGEAAEAGLGFYAYLRFHVDTKSYRRWGSAGPQGNESPCAVIERGEDPTAPPVPRAAYSSPGFPGEGDRRRRWRGPRRRRRPHRAGSARRRNPVNRPPNRTSKLAFRSKIL